MSLAKAPLRLGVWIYVLCLQVTVASVLASPAVRSGQQISSLEGLIIAVHSRQHQALAYRGDKLLIKRHSFEMPMAYYVQRNAPVSTTIGAVGISVSSGARLVRNMKNSERLLRALPEVSLESLLTDAFSEQLQRQRSTIFDTEKVRLLYRQHCGDAYRQQALGGEEKQGCEKDFEKDLGALGVNVVLYVDTGVWGFEHLSTKLLTISKKGNLALELIATLKSTQNGAILWQQADLISFVKKKYGYERRQLDEFLNQDHQLFDETLAELTAVASEQFVAHLATAR